MPNCRNPECVNGRTPGIIAGGKGNARTPVLGAVMRWGWVNCLACSATDDQRKAGASYKHQHRAPEEIAQRAQQANERAVYKKAPVVLRNLAAIKAAAGNGTYTPLNPSSVTVSYPDNSKQLAELSTKLDKLMDQNTKLSEQNGKLVDQLGELMIENRALRMQVDAQQKSGNL